MVPVGARGDCVAKILYGGIPQGGPRLRIVFCKLIPGDVTGSGRAENLVMLRGLDVGKKKRLEKTVGQRKGRSASSGWRFRLELTSSSRGGTREKLEKVAGRGREVEHGISFFGIAGGRELTIPSLVVDGGIRAVERQEEESTGCSGTSRSEQLKDGGRGLRATTEWDSDW